MGRERVTARYDDVIATAETDSSLLCEHDDWDGSIWFPKSQIDDDSEVWRKGDEGMLVVSAWIAQQKGID